MKKCFFALLGSGLILALTACGGAQSGGTNSQRCKEELAQIKAKGNVCDPAQYEQFESRVMNWQNLCADCIGFAEKKIVNDQLNASRACSDEERTYAAQRESCSSRLKDIRDNQGCFGNGCAPLLEGMNRIITDCDEPRIRWEALSEANALRDGFQRKMDEDSAKQAALHSMDAVGEKRAALVDQGDIDTGLLTLLETLEKSGPLVSAIPSDSPLNGEKTVVIHKFGDTLKRAVEAFSDLAAQELMDPRVKKNPDEWMTRYRKLEETHSRLEKAGASTLFPGAINAIKEAVDKFGKIKGRQATNEERKKTAAVRKALTKGAGQCKQILKTMARVETKIKQYQAKNNAKKVAAYESRLQKAKQALTDLKDNIRTAMDEKILPEDQQTALIEEIRQAGCYEGSVKPAEAAAKP